MAIISKYVMPVLVLSIICSFVLNPPCSLGQSSHNDSNGKGLPVTQQSNSVHSIQDSLNLKQCLQIALENNPRMGYRQSEIAETIAQRDRTAGLRWPTVHGSGSYTRYSDTQRMAVPQSPDYPMIFADNVFTGNIVIRMPVFTRGRIINEIRAAELLIESAEYRFRFTRAELIFNVTSIYYNIFKQHKLIASLDFSRATLEEHLDRTKELISAQKAAGVDRLRMEVRLANISQKIEQEKSVLAIQKRVLANYMGNAESAIAISLPDAAVGRSPVANLNDCLLNALQNRSDFQAALKTVEAQSRRIKAARAVRWPSVSFYGAYGVKKAAGTYIAPPGVNGLDEIGQAGVLLDIPFFEGGRINARIHREEARLTSLQEKLRELDLRIRLEVESAYHNLISTGKRISAVEKAVEQANETCRIEKEKYNLGKGSVTDILDAESALLEMKTNYAIASADYHIYAAQLRFAQGEANEKE